MDIWIQNLVHLYCNSEIVYFYAYFVSELGDHCTWKQRLKSNDSFDNQGYVQVTGNRFFRENIHFLLRKSRETHNSRWLILCTIWPVGSSWTKLTLTTGCSSFITELQPFFAWQEQLWELRHNTLVTQSGRGLIKNAFDFDYDSTSSQSMWNRKSKRWEISTCSLWQYPFYLLCKHGVNVSVLCRILSLFLKMPIIYHYLVIEMFYDYIIKRLRLKQLIFQLWVSRHQLWSCAGFLLDTRDELYTAAIPTSSKGSSCSFIDW